MPLRRYSEVDVFSRLPYFGNPVAVVHDADDLTTEQMQRFATWTNLAETTFLLAPTDPAADYRVRIFSATQEFPFAGHPTLGSAFAWMREGGRPGQGDVVIQECGAGLVDVKVEGERYAFAAPPLTRYEPVDEAHLHAVASALGIARDRILAASWLVNGPAWVGVELSSADEVLALRPDPASLGAHCIGVVGPHPAGHDAQFEVRAFLGGDPVWEDPVTGSLNAGMAQWLRDRSAISGDYVAAQGTVTGRRGRVHISLDGGQIWVGGDVVSCVRGSVAI